MSKKLQALKDLKRRLEEDPGQFVKNHYRWVKNGKIQYDVIGHLLNIAGWKDGMIEELENKFGNLGIGQLVCGKTDIEEDANYLLTNNLGFTTSELEILQAANDSSYLSYPNDFSELLYKIDQMIKEESKNDGRLDGETALP